MTSKTETAPRTVPPDVAEAAAELGAALDEWIRLDAEYERLAAEGDRARLRRFEDGVWGTTLERRDAAGRRFLEALDRHGLDGVAVAGRIYARQDGLAYAELRSDLLTTATVLEMSRVAGLDGPVSSGKDSATTSRWG